jgi:hypothetical protein
MSALDDSAARGSLLLRGQSVARKWGTQTYRSRVLCIGLALRYHHDGKMGVCVVPEKPVPADGRKLQLQSWPASERGTHAQWRHFALPKSFQSALDMRSAALTPRFASFILTSTAAVSGSTSSRRTTPSPSPCASSDGRSPAAAACASRRWPPFSRSHALADGLLGGPGPHRHRCLVPVVVELDCPAGLEEAHGRPLLRLRLRHGVDQGVA